MKFKTIVKSITLIIILSCIAYGFSILALSFAAKAVLLCSILLTIHGVLTLCWMLYAWENPDDAENHQSPRTFLAPQCTFTSLIPARHEECVIADTIAAVNAILYPENMKEILVLCRQDDAKTIDAAVRAIASMHAKNAKVLCFSGEIVNKPFALNVGLQYARNNVIAVFDAEDEPHPDIFNTVNTVMIRTSADIVQSGIQLMNYRSRWFSAINVVEYFFWFKSGLLFFSKWGKVSPLGGNTVFIKKETLLKNKGWDTSCLTEDADLGIRLAIKGAKTSIIYDAQHATREETPDNVWGFVKQRTRWNQGFLQIALKSQWLKLPSFRRKAIALYILISPYLQILTLFYIPVALYYSITFKMPDLVSLISFTPLYLLLIQVVAMQIGLYEFTNEYGLKYSILAAAKMFFFYLPYQLLLLVSSLRAVFHVLFGIHSWEKTIHTNAHRQMNYSKDPYLTTT